VAPRIYFCFHYEDVETFRANVVRNHDLTKETGKAGFFDASIWEEAELHGADSVKGLINRNLENTSVTCALIGSETWKRRWVRYEILKSYDRGNKLFGIHINGVKDKYQRTYAQGKNPFSFLGFVIGGDGKTLTYYEHDGSEWQLYRDLPAKSASFDIKWCGKGYALSQWVPCYDWTTGNGYQNFASWADDAK
jgi:hypothetical protein